MAYVDDLEEMKSGDIDEIGRYVFASCWTDNEELRQKVAGMSGLGQSILEEGIEKGDAQRLVLSVRAASAKLGSVEKDKFS